MIRANYQSSLGFELVTVEFAPLALPNVVQVHVIREDGADDREATLTERVLWTSLVAALDALNDAESVLRCAPDINTNCLGKKPMTTTVAALSKARAVLKSNGVAL